MRNRGIAVVVVIAVLIAVTLWLRDPPEAEVVTVPEAPAIVVAAPEPDAAVVVEHVADAAVVVTKDEEDAGSTKPLGTTYYLRPGNTITDFPESNTEFQLACKREAQACEDLFARNGQDAVNIVFTLEGQKGSARVTGYSPLMEMTGGPTPFSDCLLKGLKGLTFIDTDAEQRGCALLNFRMAHDPTAKLARAVAQCVGPESKAEVITITRSVRIVGASLVTDPPNITSLGRLDLSAENCIRQAAQVAPVPLRADQLSQKPEQPRTLHVVLAGEIGGHIDQDEAHRLGLTERRTTPRVAPTEEALVEAIQKRKLAEAALNAGNAKEAVRLLRECLSVDTDNVDCLRGSALAWLEYLRQKPGFTSVAAAKIWVRFATEMPPDDPDMPKVTAALVRMGVHLR